MKTEKIIEAMNIDVDKFTWNVGPLKHYVHYMKEYMLDIRKKKMGQMDVVK
jgi:hypothetical protein